MSAIPRRRTLPAVWLLLAIAAFGFVVFEVSRGQASQEAMRLVGRQLNVLAWYISGPHALDGNRLYGFAFIGGLVASISPCILTMLPVNLSYIGAANVESRAAALRLGTLFVTGVIGVNTALGLVSALFFAVFIQYRGEVNIAVGAATIVLALWMAQILRLRIPPAIKMVPRDFGPLAVGAAFALAVSPCSSPVLIAVLGAATKEASAVRAVGAMAAYSVGYAAVLWIASISTGFITVSRRMAPYGELISKLSAYALLALGLGTVVYGISLL